MFQILGLFIIIIAFKMVIANDENAIVNTIFETFFNTATINNTAFNTIA